MTRRAEVPAPASFTPSARALGALCVLGALAALWSAVLWRELIRSRSGIAPLCVLGDPGDCAAVWNAPFAVTVGRATGVPVAGWGLLWGLVALLLPALRLMGATPSRGSALVTAIRLTAAAGVMAVFVLGAVSASERMFCSSCFVAYLPVLGYAAIALFGWSRAGLPEGGGALAWAAGALLGAYGLVLLFAPRPPETAATPPSVTLAPADADPDRALREFVDSLPPAGRQGLSDTLEFYRQSPAFPLPPPRALHGPASAPVRVTEWTDVLCGHCADLHATWQALLPHLPAGSVAIESRHYPLDGECNPAIKVRGKDPVRCLAARVQICVEADPGAFEVQGSLFAAQRGLTPEQVFGLAAGQRPRAELEACARSESTGQRLREDLELAARYQPEGTPLVAINGRRATGYGPFLYAIVLARGDGSHRAFAALPPPQPLGHVH
jgi:thioredoxin family protein